MRYARQRDLNEPAIVEALAAATVLAVAHALAAAARAL